MDINFSNACLGLLLAKNKNNEFIVDVLLIDSGIIPRIVIIENGLPLMTSKYYSMHDFYIKQATSLHNGYN